MIETRVAIKSNIPAVKARAEPKIFKSVQQAAATIRLIARRSLRKRKKAGPAGAPMGSPTTRAKNAIVFAPEGSRFRFVVGPAKTFIGEVGGAHEHGGEFRGADYPARPFMGPALERALPRLPKEFEGSVL